MKTKEELLQSIYGAEYIHADINGWMKYGMYHPNDLGFDNDEVDRYGDMYLWRPKSLQGIEDNNGWISINSEKDLPNPINGGLWEIIRNGEQYFVELLAENTIRLFKDFQKDGVTHYKIHNKSNPPLHK